MQIEHLINAMNPTIYKLLCAAVETGKWANGEALSDEQKENALQAIMLYQSKIDGSDQHMTVGKDGEIVQKSRQQLQQEMKHQKDGQTPIAKFKNDDI
ncbi:MAG: DUF1315 family protein [Pseudomonadota bacterium]